MGLPTCAGAMAGKVPLCVRHGDAGEARWYDGT